MVIMNKKYLSILMSFMPCLAFAEPVNWQISFQEASSTIMEQFVHFSHSLHLLALGIVVFVFLLLLYVCIRFKKSNNPIPSKTTHHTLLEIIWTTVPVIIVVFIAITSMKILYFADTIPEAELTVKVVGHQWYWSYEYPDNGNFGFDSYIIPDSKLKPGDRRLLEVDNRIVLPVDTNIRVLITSADVIHSWAVPAFGIKQDAVPGRTNETWLRITKPGTYFGQCSELCGIGHGFMPIAIEAKSKADFEEWTKAAKQKFSYIAPTKNIQITSLLN